MLSSSKLSSSANKLLKGVTNGRLVVPLVVVLLVVVGLGLLVVVGRLKLLGNSLGLENLSGRINLCLAAESINAEGSTYKCY